jgi:glycerol-3-phosphate dehydrogenase
LDQQDTSAIPIHDLAVIGGGINGGGIARDAAGRGLKVVLFEKDDLASGTSSASTKLIHGGLRYLEHGELRLVREALAEREVLRTIAPHLVRPLRFVLPHRDGMRPFWKLRLGLMAYDFLAGRGALPRSASVKLAGNPLGAPLKPNYVRGLEYSDCFADDARLVALTVRDAADRGANVFTRTEVVAARREGALWRLTVARGGQRGQVLARALVDAAGPWAGDVLDALKLHPAPPLRLVQGSHIVVPRLYPQERAYVFQIADGRIVFAIPYEADFTLIGTTDRDVSRPAENAQASPEEIAYLCAAASAYFAAPVTPSDVVWAFAGVRALAGDAAGAAQDASRDYALALDAPREAAPLLTILGGKLTTHRRLAEAALDKLAPHLPLMAGSWTGKAALPGGDFPFAEFDTVLRLLRTRFAFLDKRIARRMFLAYGTMAFRILGDARSEAELGPWFGPDLCRREVDHLMDREWAMSADDILWRRTKLGLHIAPADAVALADYMETRDAGVAV